MSEDSTVKHLFPELELAPIPSVKVATLHRWRWAGPRPAFCKIATTVRHHPAQLDKFVEAIQWRPAALQVQGL
jgi:hypothetical protein